ncbi:uncharacterized protein LOC127773776 isoform X2 [Oryza glaberrima]|uniref:uncharacterized protein LOC127773776 isoform X2 n=1 Tax=Oryza glaberrima TaxID=4538 RepID=UPI00224C477E|nr:uncharacterized protein LOC127773776 isoform X2 [Oryza glaberrima]
METNPSSAPAMALQLEKQIVAPQNGSVVQRVGDDDSQHGASTLGSPIPFLPESFLRSWRCLPNLTLNQMSLCWIPYGQTFSCKVDNILRNHSAIGLKTLTLNLNDDHATFPYVNSWLQVAFTAGIEELTLRLHEKYNFPCSLLSDGVRKSIRYLELKFCAFHPTVEVGPLRSLTTLYLNSVRITGDELECLLSNSLALERLQLIDIKDIVILKIPCLQQLNSLGVMLCQGLEVIECKAPNLSRVNVDKAKIKFSPGEALQMKDLTLRRANCACHARVELPSIMPNLQRLLLRSLNEVVNTPMLPSKFLHLKHLTISMISGSAFSPSYDYFSLVSFLDASPSLETLFLDVSQGRMEHESVFGGGSSAHLRQFPELHRHDRLKSVEIMGFSSAKGLVELTCCIVKKAVSLERLVLNTLRHNSCCSKEYIPPYSPFNKVVLDEAFRAVAAIRSYIQDEVPPEVNLTVVEPCARCYSFCASS